MSNPPLQAPFFSSLDSLSSEQVGPLQGPTFDEMVSKGLFEEDYEVDWQEEPVGVGAQAEVRLCTHRSTETRHVVKILPHLPSTLQEIRNHLRCMRHPNIVQILSIYKSTTVPPCFASTNSATAQYAGNSARFKKTDYLYIVMEYLEGGELFFRIKTLKRFTEAQTKVLAEQAVSALAHIHSLGIIHRDVKPENMILCSNDKDDFTFKLGDFGFSTAEPPKSPKYTINYCAPEVLRCERKFLLPGSAPPVYDGGCDVWSLGVVIYVCLCGYTPFYSKTSFHAGSGMPPSMRAQILSGEFDFPTRDWNLVSMTCKEMIRKMLVPKLSDRITIHGLQMHPWISSPVNQLSLWLSNSSLSRPSSSLNPSSILTPSTSSTSFLPPRNVSNTCIPSDSNQEQKPNVSSLSGQGGKPKDHSQGLRLPIKDEKIIPSVPIFNHPSNLSNTLHMDPSSSSSSSCSISLDQPHFKLNVMVVNPHQARLRFELVQGPSTPVADVMALVALLRPDLPVSRQRFICSGRLMKRDLTLADYNITKTEATIFLAPLLPTTCSSEASVLRTSNAPHIADPNTTNQDPLTTPSNNNNNNNNNKTNSSLSPLPLTSTPASTPPPPPSPRCPSLPQTLSPQTSNNMTLTPPIHPPEHQQSIDSANQSLILVVGEGTGSSSGNTTLGTLYQQHQASDPDPSPALGHTCEPPTPFRLQDLGASKHPLLLKRRQLSFTSMTPPSPSTP